MDPLELICPRCREVLTLDRGFAGGVCRCAQCGTIMTVPASSKKQQRNTTTIRRDRPDTPAGFGPSALQPRPEKADPEHTPATAAPPDKPPPPPSQPAAPTRTTPTHTPASPTTPEPASPRSSKRLLIFATAITGFTLVIGSCVLSVGLLARHQADIVAKSKQQPDIVVDFTFNPETNPYQLESPNLLGLPLSKQTVAVIDASAKSRPWLGLVKDAVMAGTDFDTAAVGLQVVLASQDQPEAAPHTPTALRDLERGALRTFLNSALAFGQADLITALSLALASNPQHVIIVTGQQISTQQVKQIQGLLRDSYATRFDAVLIGIQSNALVSLADRYDGQYVAITPQRLDAWRYEMP